MFQYVDDRGNRRTIHSGDVNEYLREITGEDFSAKDFRTWAGTMGAADVLLDRGPGGTARESKKQILEAVETVARNLGNRPVTCRNYYIHPAVLDAFPSGRLQASIDAPTSGFGALSRREHAIMALLRKVT